MNNGIHFISGLPRSGSTLLSAILRQNPRIHAGITSPVGGLVRTVLAEMSEANEGAVFIDDERRASVIRGLVEGYYHDVHASKVVLDTNRLWCSKLPAVRRLFPGAKVICCVRDVPWVYDSVEKLIRANALQPSKLFNFDAGGTVYDRFDLLNRSNGLVGFAWASLREAYFSEHAPSLLLVTYETLTQDPGRALDEIYDFIGEPRYAHSFDSIEFDVAEFDRRLGTPGLHRVGAKVSKETTRRSILPPELFQRVSGDSFWKDPSTNIFGAKVI